MVILSFTMSEYNKITKIISLVDKEAFMTIHRAHEISGKGFTIDKED